MKNTINWKTLFTRTMAFLLVAGILFGTVLNFTAANAASTDEAVRMNVMLVIDGSGSLVMRNGATDPKGLRYDAIDLFLALLTNEGNNVGAIVFNGESDSFLLDSPLHPLNGKADKVALSESIRNAGAHGDTNIGAALRKAVQDASSKSEENGMPSVVILFSDGRTEVAGENGMENSLRAKEDAMVMAQDAGIPIYTICLKANDIADPAEMEEIAERTSGSFVTVNDAADLASAFEAFYGLIFGSAGSELTEDTYPENGKITISIPIPSYGADEVNIIVDTTDLRSIDLSSPSHQLSANEIDDNTMSGGYYDVTKLVNPEHGQWYVELTGVPEEKVTINVLYNMNSTAVLQTSDGKTDYNSGDTVAFEANLVQNGTPIRDGAVTGEYAARLTVTDMASGKDREYAMSPDSNGTFVYNMKADDYTSYTATATLTYCDIVLTTPVISVNVGNTAPSANPEFLEVKKTVTPFSGKNYENDVSAFFTDAQDSKLTYSVLSSQLVKDTFELDPNTGKLNVNTGESKSGELVIQAADSQGATAQMTIRFRVTNLTWTLSGILLLILCGLAVLGIIAYLSTIHTWKGILTVQNLTSGMQRQHGSFRGTLKLDKLSVGPCGIEGKFKAGAGNGLDFISTKPLYIQGRRVNPQGKKYIVRILGNTDLYADENRSQGLHIEVNVSPKVRGGNPFGGAGRKSVSNAGSPFGGSTNKGGNRGGNPFGGSGNGSNKNGNPFGR